jgi:hypothetical protein
MPQREIDSLSSDGAQLVASLLARIDRLMARIAARDDRIYELLMQVKALNTRPPASPAAVPAPQLATPLRSRAPR